MTERSRLAPRPRAEWDDAVTAAVQQAFGDSADRYLADTPAPRELPVAITTMLHHPELAGPWLQFNNVLLWSGSLGHRRRELMVLRVAWRTGSNYEWLQHVRLAQSLGLTVDEIDAVAMGTGTWSSLESALLRATDELLDDHCVSAETWTTLAAELDERQLLEAVFVVGAYGALAMLFKSLALPVEPGSVPTAVGLPSGSA